MIERSPRGPSRLALISALTALTISLAAVAQTPPADAPAASSAASATTPPPATSASSSAAEAPAASAQPPAAPPGTPATGAAASTSSTSRAQPEAKAPSKASNDDAELEAIQRASDIEQSVTNSAEPKLSIYGFADFTYRRNTSPKNSFFYTRNPFDSFSVGNVNLYLDGSAGNSLRSLLEVRLLYLPNGGISGFSNNGEVQWTDTSTPDYAEEERPIRWGGIELERVWVEYVFNNYIAVRAGQWLTPYGIWNVDHGSPTVIPIARPYIIGEELFPERQTGLEFYGKVFVGPTTVGYHATVSNGRGPADSFRDKDSNKAVGGRLYTITRPFGEIQLGASVYRGHYSDYHAQLALQPTTPPSVSVQRTPFIGFAELSVAGDLHWQWENLLVQAEIISNERAYDNDGRNYLSIAGQPTVSNGTAPADFRRWGAYAFLGYRTPLFGIMPYTYVQYYNSAGNPNVPPIRSVTIGANVRPLPSLVLKAEYFVTKLGDANSTELFRGTYSSLAGQVAWAF